MKRKRIRKILIIAFSVCFVVANVTSISYAVDPVTFTEAETLGATIVDLYGAYNNTSLAYEQLSESGALTEIVTLYNNYASNASDPYTLAAIGAAAAAAGAIAVIYDAVTGQGYVQLYQEQYISSLDGYWDYQLADVGFVRDSITNLFNWTESNNNVYPVPIFTDYTTTINGHTVHYLPVQSTANAFYDSPYNDVFEFSAVRTNGTYGVLYIGSFSPNRTAALYQQGQPEPTQFSLNTSETIGDTTLYFTYFSGWNPSNPNNLITPDFVNTLSYSDLNYPLENLFGVDTNNNNIVTDQEEIAINPSIYIGDPLQNPLEISIPDVSDPNYAPQPARINTNIPWDPDWGTPVENPVPGVAYPVTDPVILNDAVPGIWESIVSDGVEVGDPESEPEDPGADANEVTIPFLPITLPSFNFNLSGIWHYVVTWVASLGAWFTTLFTIWSCLPYAMVVPVYATAVIVIVLGVYRRFLT